MTRGPGADQEARRLIHEAIDETLVVEAAAGTGKTTALVQRIVRVVAEGRARLRDIVAVTFTEKAAGELKLRLRQQLEEARDVATDPESADRLLGAVQELEEAHVSTIHGFCADLLRERPVEARVDPLFRVLTEGQAEALFNQAFDRWFEEALAEAPEGVRRSLRRSSRALRPGEADEDGPRERLRRAGLARVEWRDFGAAWSRDVFDRRTAIVRLVALVHELADLTKGPSYRGDGFFLDTEPVRRLSRDLRRAASTSIDEDLDGLEARLVDLARHRDLKRGRKGSGPTYAPGVTRGRLVELRERLTNALTAFQIEADADLASRLRDELEGCVDRYEALKAREGALDFLDLLLRARNLVLNHAEVRRYFQERFARLFIDEFQDTDPLQAELLLLLSSGDPGETRWERVTPVPGKLFIVGDPKQSIYRFRRADVDVYRRVCDQLVDRGARRVELRKSFRSVENLQRFVNAAFAPLMDGDPETGQARYVPLERDRPDQPGQPSIVVLPVPAPYGQRNVSARQIESSLPDAVGAFVDWLVRRSGWTVTERQAPGRVPVAPRHVCVLFRRFVSYGEDITRPYVEALEARGVRHLLVGGRAFHDRDEIEALRAALAAVEWPDDQLSVFATLRGPLFAIGDEELLEFQHRHGRFHPFRIPDASGDDCSETREALAVLRALHLQRNRRPIADTISALLAHTRAHAGLVLRPGGEQALANVLHVVELARQYEIDGGLSFRGFVDSLQEAARGASAAEAPILEESSEGVRLMTVHKAKGLEFPVVVLADLTARLVPRDASRYLDLDARRCAFRIGGWSPKDLNDHREMELLREQKEGERVAYVAATRARDLLVVPAVGDGSYEVGWLSPLDRAIYPEPHARRVASPAEGCPPFVSRDSVLTRPASEPALPTTVCPGAHTMGPLASPHAIVWWSPEPGVLELGAQLSSGLRRDDLIVRDVPANVLREQLDRFEAWQFSKVRAIESASRPSIEILTATEAATRSEGPMASGVTTSFVVHRDGRDRPSGPRFGSLVHALLAHVPLAADDGDLASLAATHGRILGATREEIDEAGVVAKRTLEHPVLEGARRAAARGQCHRETPVTLRLESGTLVEGYVDLAFRDDEGYVVVDFKTDRELENAEDRYERQVSLYAEAIARATGVPTRAILLRI